MDVELMCLMRHLRRSGRSAWGRGHPREKPGADGGLGAQCDRITPLKDPGDLREQAPGLWQELGKEVPANES